MDTAKRPKLRVPAVASFYYLSASVVAKGVSLLTTPVFTRLMSAEEYGEYTLYVSWIAILYVFSTLEIGGNVMNRSLLGADEKRDATVFSACSLSLLNSTAFLVLATVFSSLFSIITGLGSEMLFLLCLQMICDGVVSIILASERFRYSYKRVFVLNTLSSVIPPIISILLMRTAEATALIRITVILGVSACIGAYVFTELIIRIRGRIKLTFVIREWKRILSLAIPLLPYYLCKTAANSADKLIISYSFGKTYLARYSVAASIGLAPYFLVTSLSYAVSPWIMRKLAKSEYEKIKYTVTSLCLLILSAITLITVFGKEALSFLAPEEFSDSIGAIYPLGLSIIPAFLIQTVGTVATYENKTRITSVAAVTGTAVGVLSELILAQFGVYTLTSFGALIINLTTLIAVLFLFKDGRRIIESRKIFSLFLLSCVLMIISFIFRENLSLRLLLAIPPSLALVRIASGITEQITE